LRQNGRQYAALFSGGTIKALTIDKIVTGSIDRAGESCVTYRLVTKIKVQNSLWANAIRITGRHSWAVSVNLTHRVGELLRAGGSQERQIYNALDHGAQKFE